MLEGLQAHLKQIQSTIYHGTVHSTQGGLVEVKGFSNHATIGNQCFFLAQGRSAIPGEIVSFRDGSALVMAFEDLAGVGPGCPIEIVGSRFELCPSNYWLGRIINGFGKPIDKNLPLIHGKENYVVTAAPLAAYKRARLGGRIDLGVRAINTFTTCCEGQRLGIFAGSGVGKSVLLSQIARFSDAEVIIIGLIGERGREVQEFIQDHLGEKTLKRSVVIVATSDEPALMRRQAAYVTLTVAEYFRDQGYKVLCLMDSVTRFAMALREIGLSIGESPATKGYTPSVYAELPRLLERAGPGEVNHPGSITGLFTVLVEGDDTNEPVSDTVRGILDGHIMLDRKIAARNRFPAINVLQSISRTMPDCNSEGETFLINKARNILSIIDDFGEMIKLGAYRSGTDPEVDQAIAFYKPLEAFLSQDKNQDARIDEGFAELNNLFKTKG